MNIIANKNQDETFKTFIQNIEKDEFIKGFTLYITKTKDEEIVVYSQNKITEEILYNIQNNNFIYLNNEVIKLEEFFEITKFIDKDIFIFVTPILTPILSDSNIKSIYDENVKYINKISDIIKKQNKTNIYINSTSRVLINLLYKNLQNYKIGFELSINDLNYIDTDYYILKTTMLNNAIIDEQFSKNKKIFIMINTIEDLDIIYNYINKNIKYLNKLNYICTYPNIFYNLFYEKNIYRY